jgi:hypothetical protein
VLRGSTLPPFQPLHPEGAWRFQARESGRPAAGPMVAGHPPARPQPSGHIWRRTARAFRRNRASKPAHGEGVTRDETQRLVPAVGNHAGRERRAAPCRGGMRRTRRRGDRHRRAPDQRARHQRGRPSQAPGTRDGLDHRADRSDGSVLDGDPKPVPLPSARLRERGSGEGGETRLDPHGRGLYLVSVLASASGTYVPRTGGKAVWFEVRAYRHQRHEESGARFANVAGQQGVIPRSADRVWSSVRLQRVRLAEAIASAGQPSSAESPNR